MKRSHHCNQLRKENAGTPATLIGWIDSLRDHGGVFFLDLRDREGKTQVVLDPENKTLSELFPRLKPESVIGVSGETRKRDVQRTEIWTSEKSNYLPVLSSYTASPNSPISDDDTTDKVGDLR